MTVSLPRRYWLFAKDLFVKVLGRSMNITHYPALLREFEFVDPATDETIYLYTSNLYSVLCVGSRRFYFNRISGKYDGTSAPSDCVSRRVELAD
jgi:hypothetical protein